MELCQIAYTVAVGNRLRPRTRGADTGTDRTNLSFLKWCTRQRILLARALYKRPAFLFLDEATSALDVEKERQVNASLRQLALTKIVIAHRPETIASAQRVVALHAGKVAQDLRSVVQA